MKFTADHPFAKPEAAARKLLGIVLSADIDIGQYAYTGQPIPRSCRPARILCPVSKRHWSAAKPSLSFRVPVAS
jgi:hypothetical protein